MSAISCFFPTPHFRLLAGVLTEQELMTPLSYKSPLGFPKLSTKQPNQYIFGVIGHVEVNAEYEAITRNS